MRYSDFAFDVWVSVVSIIFNCCDNAVNSKEKLFQLRRQKLKNVYRILDINECDNHPCQHGGKCVTLKPSGYKCDCTKGFTDNHCETGMISIKL